jgi:RNA polymerase sigma-70 factor (ECF subfamily)
MGPRGPVVAGFEPNGGQLTLTVVDATSISTLAAGTPPRLVEAAAAGDADAFRRLVEPHLETALRASTVLIGSESEASDAVQDALLAAWQTLAKLRDPQAFPAWFRRIVVRSAMRQARSRGRVFELDLEAPSHPGGLDRSIEVRQLARAFAVLSPDDRLALTLRHLWGVPTSEAARLMGVPEGTVKSRTFHALDRLRAAYAAEERR